MDSLKNKTVRFWDHGLYLELARRLARDFGKVQYFCPWESAFPKSNVINIGSGVEEFEKIINFFDDLDSVDLFVFPDIYSASLQSYLESIGKRVWGSKRGEDLEIERIKAKKYFKNIGINIGEYYTTRGISNLRELLKDKENVYVKITLSRGDTETFHCENYSIVEPKLTELEYKLGAKKELIDFIVEKHIEGIEISYDGYCVDGMFAKTALLGLEIKGKCYIGAVKDYSEFPDQVVRQNNLLEPALRYLRYRNFFSPESRLSKDGTLYLTDPCCRMPSTGDCYNELFENISEIIWEGSEGRLVEPVCKFKYVASLEVLSPFASKNPVNVKFPEELRENIKFRYLTVIDGNHFVIPQPDEDETLCSIIAMGDTLEEAIERCKTYSKEVKGYELEIFPESLDEALEKVEQLENFGIDF